MRRRARSEPHQPLSSHQEADVMLRALITTRFALLLLVLSLSLSRVAAGPIHSQSGDSARVGGGARGNTSSDLLAPWPPGHGIGTPRDLTPGGVSPGSI